MKNKIKNELTPKQKRRRNELRPKTPGEKKKKKEGDAYLIKAKEESKEFVGIWNGEVSWAAKMLKHCRRILGIWKKGQKGKERV